MSRRATGTKQRLLSVAYELISDRGYADVTIQEICDIAKANLASINYYFNSKLNLYRTVWAHAHEKLIETLSLDETILGLPVEEKFEKYIDIRLTSILDEGELGRLPKLVHHEMTNPSEIHEELIATFIKPKMDLLRGIVKEYMSNQVSALELECLVFNINSQCIQINHTRDDKAAMFKHGVPTQEEKDVIISSLKKFIVGGLRAYRDNL